MGRKKNKNIIELNTIVPFPLWTSDFVGPIPERHAQALGITRTEQSKSVFNLYSITKYIIFVITRDGEMSLTDQELSPQKKSAPVRGAQKKGGSFDPP
jgi:hypothetical protein